jgi:hypothetical protein
MPICDGCGTRADGAHIRRRIERLELATRYRPIHIQGLLIDASPPGRPEDYFYRAASDRSARSDLSRMYFEELTRLIGRARGSEIDEEGALADFQRRGLFLTYAVECPIENPEELKNAIGQLAPTVLKRILASYKPKQIALLSPETEELIRDFQLAGLDGRLVLDRGRPFSLLLPSEGKQPAGLATSFGERIAKALACLPG